MTIGKREQIVVGVILAIIVIAALHLALFAPQQRDLADAHANYDSTYQTVSQMTKVGSPKELDDYVKSTNELLTELDKGVNSISSLKAPDEFQYPAKDDPNLLAKLMWKLTDQNEDILAQTAKLVQYSNSQKTKMDFLSQKWAIPAALPPTMQTASLNDAIVELKVSLDTLNIATSGAIKDQIQGQYNQNLLNVGLDLAKASRLKQYGEFVPMFYKYQICNLIIDRLTAGKTPVELRDLMNKLDTTKTRQFRSDFIPQMIGVGAKYDQTAIMRISITQSVMELLNVTPPTAKIGEEVPETGTYFMYYELFFLNQMLDLAEKQNIPRISDVTIWGYAYLRKEPTDDKKLPDLVTEVKVDSLQDDRRLPYNYLTGGAKAATKGGGLLDMLTPEELNDAKTRQGYTEEELAQMGPEQYPILFPDGANNTIQVGVGAGAGGGAGAAAPKADVKPEDDDIGYAFPIEVSFQATSKDGWGFIYSVLNQSPLNQLFRIEVSSGAAAGARPENASLYNFDAEFIFVSKLKTIEEVQQKLQQLNPTAAPAPGGAPAAAAPVAAAPAAASAAKN